VAHNDAQAFAVWITGLPSSGKSTLARALKAQLGAQGHKVAILESDALRNILSDQPPRYDDAGRDAFYRLMAHIGGLLVENGVPVIFDATANRRAYRDRARRRIGRFLEVYVECPLDICMARDPKGIYRVAREDPENRVPGLQAPYEPPEEPDIVVRADQEPPEGAAARVIAKLVDRGYL